jgi:hypothetical protein
METPDETKAVSKTAIQRLLSRRDLPLRERTLWRMLYETAARASEILDSMSRTWTCRTAKRRSGRRAARFLEGGVHRGAHVAVESVI